MQHKMNNPWFPVDENSWDWISVRDRFATLSDCLDVPVDDPQDLANELRSIAEWIRRTG